MSGRLLKWRELPKASSGEGVGMLRDSYLERGGKGRREGEPGGPAASPGPQRDGAQGRRARPA